MGLICQVQPGNATFFFFLFIAITKTLGIGHGGSVVGFSVL
jgi:hypothetical protein